MKPKTRQVLVTSGAALAALVFLVLALYNQAGGGLVLSAVALFFIASGAVGLAIRARGGRGIQIGHATAQRAPLHPIGCLCRHCLYAGFVAKYAPP